MRLLPQKVKAELQDLHSRMGQYIGTQVKYDVYSSAGSDWLMLAHKIVADGQDDLKVGEYLKEHYRILFERPASSSDEVDILSADDIKKLLRNVRARIGAYIKRQKKYKSYAIAGSNWVRVAHQIVYDGEADGSLERKLRIYYKLKFYQVQ